MSKTCVIMQPHYLPWLGYFELMQRSDIFVILDHVQFEKQSWQQRNRILDSKGKILLLTVPLVHGNGLERKINEVRFFNFKKFSKNHLSTIKINYAKAPEYKNTISIIEEIFNYETEYLSKFNTNLLKIVSSNIGFKTHFILSSNLDVRGNKVEALIDICKKVGCDNYYSPLGSKIYIDENNIFSENGINLEFQNFLHPIYNQYNTKEFISHLSFIDYAMNHGFNKFPI